MCGKGLGKDKINCTSGEKLKDWVSQKSMDSKGMHTYPVQPGNVE